MRTRSFCLGLVLTAVMGLAPEAARCQDVQLPAPRVVRGQDYSPPDPVFPLPLYHERPETGGFYAAGNFLMLRQTNPLKEQPIAVRGFVDTFGNVQATQNFLSEVELGVTGPTPVPGLFIGSGKPALDVNQVSGPNSYQPGFRINLGWKFQNDLDIEFSWSHLFTKKLSATAATISRTTMSVRPANLSSLPRFPSTLRPDRFLSVFSPIRSSIPRRGRLVFGTPPS